ncbi:tRNA (guanosine(46)-N7)-methyltransferase TrmB [Arthrobacter tecti]
MSTHPESQPHPAQPVSFVRRGSRLQGRRRDAWAELSEGLVVDVPRHTAADTSVDPAWEYDAAASFGREAPLVVEIGSGLGEAVAHAAAEQPERNFLALEVYRPGLAQTLLRIDQRGLTNVRVAQVNAAEALATMLRPASVTELWVFFPDPWHKTRHHKRRLVKDSFLDLAARVLEPGGVLRMATDWSDYAFQMREVADASPEFENLHDGERTGAESPLTQVWASGVEHVVGGAPRREGKDKVGTASVQEGEDAVGGWAPRFDGRILTSFENKAHDAGRMIFDLAYRRR